MTLNQSALLDLGEQLKAADADEMMRTMLGFMLQLLVDAEAAAVIGAGPHERTAARTTQRNGTRGDKTVSTTAGDLTLRIPKTRDRVVPPLAARAAAADLLIAARVADRPRPAIKRLPAR